MLLGFNAGNVMASTYSTVGSCEVNIERAASVAFAASGEYYASMVHGRPKVERPPGTTAHFNRTNFSGSKVAQPGDYEPARAKGHHPVMLLQEVSGAL